jgi:hypothetical protein
MIFAMIITMVVAISTSMRNRHRHHTSIRRSIAAARDKLAKFIQGWEAIKERTLSAPRTCTQWACYQEAAEQALLDLKYEVPRLPRGVKNYTRTWTVRLYMMMLMMRFLPPLLLFLVCCFPILLLGFTPKTGGNLLSYNNNHPSITNIKGEPLIALNVSHSHKKLGIVGRVKQYRDNKRLSSSKKIRVPITSRKPLRDISFWLRASHIYTSYKLNQASNVVRKHVFKKSFAEKKNQTWSHVHDSGPVFCVCWSVKMNDD